MSKLISGLALLACLGLLSGTAQAQDESSTDAALTESADEDAWFLAVAVQGALNPVGLNLASQAGYRVHLWDSNNLLLQGAHLDLGATGQVSPAYVEGGPLLVFAPLSIFEVRASAQRIGYFGTFGTLHNYGSLNADWSVARQTAVEDADSGQAAGGTQIEVAAALQAELGGFGARVSTRYDWLFLDVDGATVEPYYNLLLAPSDSVWTTTTVAGYAAADSLWIGALWEHTVSREGDFVRDVVGPLVSWDLPGEWWDWGAPTLTAVGGWYARDPNREGEAMMGLELALEF